MSMLIPRLFILLSNWAGRLRQVGEFLSGTDLLGLENVGKKKRIFNPDHFGC